MYYSNLLQTTDTKCRETLKKLGFKKTKNTSPYSYKYKKTRAYVAKGQVIFVSWNKKILNITEKNFLAEVPDCIVTSANEIDLYNLAISAQQEPRVEKRTKEIRNIDEIINARAVFCASMRRQYVTCQTE